MSRITPISYKSELRQVTFGSSDNTRKCISVKQYEDYDEYRYEVPATSGKKAGVAIASLLLTGAGQMINGDILKGIAFMGGTFIATLFSLVGLKSQGIASLAAFGGAVWSAVDAAKNAKSTAIQMVPKDKPKENVD